MLGRLSMYLDYPFVRYALVVGVLIALCASLLGVTLVLRRFSFIGDGLSHVAFGALAIASVMNLTNRLVLILPVTVFCAVLLLKTGQNTRVKGDAAIAMLSVGALAFVLGILQSVRGCLHHLVRVHIDSHAYSSGCMAVHRAGSGGAGYFHSVL